VEPNVFETYEHDLSRFTPTQGVMRLTPWFVTLLAANLVARAAHAKGALMLIAALALPLGVVLFVRIRRSPTKLTLNADGVWIDGPYGRTRFDPSSLALWTRGGFALTTRAQRRIVPSIAIWHDRERRDLVVERFRRAGVVIR
jgi:hypothetical protein